MVTRKQQDDVPATQELVDLLEGVYNAESLNPALETLYAELGVTDGGEATVHVTKLADDTRGTESHVWRGDPDDYDLESIAKKFGSGSYRTKIYVRILSGQKVLKANKVLSWLLPPEDEFRRLNPVAQPQQQLNGVELGRMIADAIRTALPPPVTVPPVNPMAMMKEVAELMRIMQPQSQQPPVNPMAMMRDMAETMQAMRGDMEPVERGGNANGNDLMLALINKFAPLFEKVLPAMGGMQPQAYPQLETPALQHAQPEPQPEEEDMSIKLRMGLMFLIQQCEAGGSPDTYAEVVLDAVPEEAIQALISTPDPLAYLIQFAPAIANHKEWFIALVNEIKEILKGEDDADPADPIQPPVEQVQPEITTFVPKNVVQAKKA